MNIKYEKRNNDYSILDKFDFTQTSILLLGKADTHEERRNIINPRGLKNAATIYGQDSELFNAYKQCYAITDKFNIFTVNCRSYSDYMDVLSSVIHYNFSFIVPMGIKFEDTFYNEYSNKYEYYIDYFMYLIEECQADTTIIVTSNHARDYNDIDDFIRHNDSIVKEYYLHTVKDNDNYAIYQKNGSDIIFVINNLTDVNYANAVLAGQLAIDDYTSYPNEVNYNTYFDIDNNDVHSPSYTYHKYNYLTEKASIENLVNMRLYEDVYKNALIDVMIKSIIRLLDFDAYRGKLYNGYIKLQIEKTAKSTMDSMKGLYFKNYQIKNVGFVKTNETYGYIYIELLIMPYGFMEYINVVMEV